MTDIPVDDQCCDLKCSTSLQPGSTKVDVNTAYPNIVRKDIAGKSIDVTVSLKIPITTLWLVNMYPDITKVRSSRLSYHQKL